MMAEDIRQDKKSGGNFSALMEHRHHHNSNGVSRTSASLTSTLAAAASGKTGASKKLVIKNFRGNAGVFQVTLHLMCI